MGEKMTIAGKNIKKTTCHGCTRRCGLLVTVENGRPIGLKGDTSQPMSKGFFCPRGKAMVMEQPFDNLRLRYPLKRAGKRGEGKWERISWEQALDEIAARLKKIVADFGPESVTASLDCMISTTFATRRFLRELGSPNEFTMGGQVCYGNSVKIEGIVYGQDTVCDRANSRCTVIWGCNPSVSKPEWFRYIKESKKKGGKVIAVDPFRTQCVDLADIWLQIRPGSDGAMMLAWLNVIINEGLYDKDFVETWTNAPYLVNLTSNKMLRQNELIVGGDPDKFLAWNPETGKPAAYNVEILNYDNPQLKPPLTGKFQVRLIDGSITPCTTVWELLKKHVEPFTPEKTEEITWVAANKIYAAARMFGTTRPGNFFSGFALDGIGPNANECGRLRSILSAIVGNLDVQGGQIMLGPLKAVNNDIGKTLPPEQAAKVIGERYKLWTQAATLKYYPHQKRSGNPFSPRYAAHGPSIWKAILTEDPYPVKAFLCIGSNPLVTGANVKRIERALRKLDLVVVQDLYMTPTAELADYVTPAAMDDIETCRLYTGGPGSGWLEGHSLLSGEKAIDPPGEAKSDFVFVRELGVRLGQNWPWKNDEEYYDWQLTPLGYSSFKEFHETVQWLVPEPTYKKYEKRGFGTPSAKVEIYSPFLQDLGYSPLPTYEEPPHSPFRTPDLWEQYPFVQGVMRLRYYYESCYRNLPSLRRKLPDPLIYMHPDAASAYQLKDGDWVWIESPSTPYKIKQKVKVFDGLDPRVLYPDFGWWFPERTAEEGLHGAWESNVNMLTDDKEENCCPMIGSWYINANLLRIRKVV
jgi:anaerobic selenocysteine-containing dehydrogenase